MPKLGTRPESELSALKDVKLNLKKVKTMNDVITKLQDEITPDLKLVIGKQKFLLTDKTAGAILKSIQAERKEIIARIGIICKKFRIELMEEDKTIMSDGIKESDEMPHADFVQSENQTDLSQALEENI